MVRILHLLDTTAEFETQRSASALVRGLGDNFRIDARTIGAGGDYRHLLSAVSTLRRTPSSPSPSNLGEGRGEGLTRTLTPTLSRNTGRGSKEVAYDIIHAWGGAALAAALMGAGAPIVFSPTSETRPRTIRWLRAVADHRHLEVVAPTATWRRILVERGIPLKRTHMIRPGVDFGAIRRRRNPEMRAAMGFSESDRVLLAVGESTRSAAHLQAVWAGSILHVVDPKYRMLMWGRGEQVASADRFVERLGHGGMLAIAEKKLERRVEFEELLGVADAAIVSATGAVATLPISMCMAAGLPIVSTVTYTASELLEDRHTALMSPKNNPRLLAQRVVDLFDDSRLAWSISDVARTEAYEYFSQTRFINQHRTLYRQLAAREAIEIPEVLPGAGSRFHGRG